MSLLGRQSCNERIHDLTNLITSKMNIKNKYILWTVFIIVSLGLFILAEFIPSSFWQNVIRSIAGALLISGTFSVAHAIVEKKEEEDFFAKMFAISSSVKDSGLLDIRTDSKEYSFKPVLKKSKVFAAIMNDGRTWVNQYYTDIIDRLNTSGTATEFFLVDPEGLFIPSLAQKTDYTIDKLKDKICECVELLKKAYSESEKKGSLAISFLKNYPTQSLYYADDEVIVTPYQVACGRNKVPVYVYSYKSGHETIGDFLVKDLRNVRAESRMVWNNGSEIRKEE